MPTVNEPNINLDTTVRVFDSFYGVDVTVPVDEYDAVNSFFESIYKDKAAAQSFSLSLFRIAQGTQVSALTLLEEIRDQDQIQLTNTFCYYLNTLRSPSTLLGINTSVTPTVWAARNVLP